MSSFQTELRYSDSGTDIAFNSIRHEIGIMMYWTDVQAMRYCLYVSIYMNSPGK